MAHKIKRIEFGNIHINNEVFDKDDFFLFKDLIEPTEKSHHVTARDFRHIMLREPEVVIISTGFNNVVKVDEEIDRLAEKEGIKLIKLSTPEALKKFQELSKKGIKVAARIHITC